MGYVGLACYSIFVSGSRMGMVGVVLAGTLACLASPRRSALLALYPALLVMVWMALPESHRDRYATVYQTGHRSAVARVQRIFATRVLSEELRC